MSGTILVIGGAGYIGSCTAHLLHQSGCNVIVLDSLLHGQKFLLPSVQLIQDDMGNSAILERIFKQYPIKAVMLFGALIEVGESVKYPARFYDNNVKRILTLLDSMLEYGVGTLIFSSSCAVYGVPEYTPMDEYHPRNPVNAYGKTKLTIEFALQDYAQAYGLHYVALRYFNAAGALPDYGLGEQHDPETHVLPLLLRAALNKKPFTIWGTDYDTRDGSCVRDFIHVHDIAHAHLQALHYLVEGGSSDAFNLGTGHGYTIKELVQAVERTCNVNVDVIHEQRRGGDVAVLVANHAKATSVLGWQPVHSQLQNIVSSALEWEVKKRLLFDKVQ
ncbi:MAG: UDP-glucose 4-epimerase GalE [Epsilonproteobacteria bacterium]|nr:UDP-glucose 4-epimerase GalE [Campylobacterota bacterium]